MNGSDSARWVVGGRKFFISWLTITWIVAVVAFLPGLVLQRTLLIHTAVGVLICVITPALTMLVYSILQRFSTSAVISVLFTCSLVGRVILVPILSWVFTLHTGVPFESGPVKDDYVYNNTAMALANLWASGQWELPSYIPFARGGYSGFPVLSALLMYIFTPSFWVPRLGNAVLGSSVVVLLYEIARKAWSREDAALVGAVASVSPVLMYYSATQHKDTLLLTLFLAALLGILTYVRSPGRSLTSIVKSVACLCGLVFVRAAAAVVLVVASIFGLIRSSNKPTIKGGRVSKNVVLGAAGILFAGLAFVAGWGNLSASGSLTSPLDYYQSRVQGASTVPARSSLASSSLGGMASYPLYLAVSPFVPVALTVDIPLDPADPARFRPEYYMVGPTLWLMSLAPLIVAGVINYIRSTRMRGELVIPLMATVLYKAVLANSYMLFSIRHNLPAIALGLLFIPATAKESRKQNRVLLFLLTAAQVIAFVALNTVRTIAR